MGNIGVVYKNLGNYPKALDYFQQALAINQAIGDKRGQGVDLSSIGGVYKNLGEYQKAKEFFQESAAILETVGSSDLWLAQRGLAFTEAKLNQPEPAIQHYEHALDIAFPDLVKYKTLFTFNPFRVEPFFRIPQVSPLALKIQPLSGLRSYVIVLYFTQSGNAITLKKYVVN